MLNFYTIALFLGVVGVSASPAAKDKCNADNCLRAIKGAAFVTRQGTIDCSSYFKTTVTPATVIIVSTISQTTSQVLSETDAATITSTESDFTTVTSTSTKVDVVTSTATLTNPPATITFKAKVRRDGVLAKRQAINAPSRIPAYASPCSGIVRYSSACSCVGATRTTVTAVAPSTTIYVTQVITQTSTYITTTTNTAILTDLITSTDIVVEATTSTVIATATPPPLVCGAFGFVYGTNGVVGAGLGTLSECQGYCLLYAGCQSFFYFQGGCAFFTLPVSEGALLSPDAAPQVFYDRNCPTIVDPGSAP